jgi:DNA-binding LacI/PurR family transcriptional regulator
MSHTIIAEQPAHVNRRFVAPQSEYDQGRSLYRRGERLAMCASDEMAQGWLDAEAKGADAYWMSMMQEAN